MKFQDKTIHGT